MSVDLETIKAISAACWDSQIVQPVYSLLVFKFGGQERRKRGSGFTGHRVRTVFFVCLGICFLKRIWRKLSIYRMEKKYIQVHENRVGNSTLNMNDDRLVSLKTKQF